jgi:hypothetical protein
MDDSSQNNPGIPQKPTTENSSNYPQYPTVDSVDKPRKRRNPLIFAGAGILLLLVLVSAVLFIQAKHGQSSQDMLACTSEKCFTQNFTKCLPAEYTFNESGSSVKYAITSNQGVGCTVNVKYLKSEFFTGAAGKTMTCDFDNTKDFKTAAQNVFHFPADYGCKGDLVDLFKDINTTTSGP